MSNPEDTFTESEFPPSEEEKRISELENQVRRLEERLRSQAEEHRQEWEELRDLRKLSDAQSRDIRDLEAQNNRLINTFDSHEGRALYAEQRQKEVEERLARLTLETRNVELHAVDIDEKNARLRVHNEALSAENDELRLREAQRVKLILGFRQEIEAVRDELDRSRLREVGLQADLTSTVESKNAYRASANEYQLLLDEEVDRSESLHRALAGSQKDVANTLDAKTLRTIDPLGYEICLLLSELHRLETARAEMIARKELLLENTPEASDLSQRVAGLVISEFEQREDLLDKKTAALHERITLLNKKRVVMGFSELNESMVSGFSTAAQKKLVLESKLNMSEEHIPRQSLSLSISSAQRELRKMLILLEEESLLAVSRVFVSDELDILDREIQQIKALALLDLESANEFRRTSGQVLFANDQEKELFVERKIESLERCKDRLRSAPKVFETVEEKNEHYTEARERLERKIERLEHLQVVLTKLTPDEQETMGTVQRRQRMKKLHELLEDLKGTHDSALHLMGSVEASNNSQQRAEFLNQLCELDEQSFSQLYSIELLRNSLDPSRENHFAVLDPLEAILEELLERREKFIEEWSNRHYLEIRLAMLKSQRGLMIESANRQRNIPGLERTVLLHQQERINFLELTPETRVLQPADKLSELNEKILQLETEIRSIKIDSHNFRDLGTDQSILQDEIDRVSKRIHELSELDEEQPDPNPIPSETAGLDVQIQDVKEEISSMKQAILLEMRRESFTKAIEQLQAESKPLEIAFQSILEKMNRRRRQQQALELSPHLEQAQRYRAEIDRLKSDAHDALRAEHPEFVSIDLSTHIEFLEAQLELLEGIGGPIHELEHSERFCTLTPDNWNNPRYFAPIDVVEENLRSEAQQLSQTLEGLAERKSDAEEEKAIIDRYFTLLGIESSLSASLENPPDETILRRWKQAREDYHAHVAGRIEYEQELIIGPILDDLEALVEMETDEKRSVVSVLHAAETGEPFDPNSSEDLSALTDAFSAARYTHTSRTEMLEEQLKNLRDVTLFDQANLLREVASRSLDEFNRARTNNLGHALSRLKKGFSESLHHFMVLNKAREAAKADAAYLHTQLTSAEVELERVVQIIRDKRTLIETHRGNISRYQKQNARALKPAIQGEREQIELLRKELEPLHTEEQELTERRDALRTQYNRTLSDFVSLEQKMVNEDWFTPHGIDINALATHDGEKQGWQQLLETLHSFQGSIRSLIDGVIRERNLRAEEVIEIQKRFEAELAGRPLADLFYQIGI